MDQTFINAAHEAFNPYRTSSGTESVATLLYSLARVGRFETVVEFGSGFTTLFLARAMADNHRDYVEHRAKLIARGAEHRDSLMALLQHELLNDPDRPPDAQTLDDLLMEYAGKILYNTVPPVAP